MSTMTMLRLLVVAGFVVLAWVTASSLGGKAPFQAVLPALGMLFAAYNLAQHCPIIKPKATS